MKQDRLKQITEQRLTRVPESSKTEVWELAEKASEMFMPISGPRPIVPYVLSKPSIALSRIGGWPPEYNLETVGDDGNEIGNGVVDKPYVFVQILEFGINSQAGERKIIAGSRFAASILYFLLRTEQGLVILPYESDKPGELAQYPAVLREDELGTLVEIFSDPKVRQA